MFVFINIAISLLTYLLPIIGLMIILPPIVVRFTQRHSRFSQMEPRTAGSLPQQVREFFSTVGNSLEDDGFIPVAYFYHSGHVPNIVSYYSLWVNPITRDTVLIADLNSNNGIE